MNENNKLEIQEPSNKTPNTENIEDGNALQDTQSNNGSGGSDSSTETYYSLDAADNISNVERQTKKFLSFPLGIFFIVGIVLFESFNYYGTEVLWGHYRMTAFGVSFEEQLFFLHLFKFLRVLFCVLGAIISDSWLDKFRTILCIATLNIIGSVLNALGALPYFKFSEAHTFFGFGLLALSSGFIPPCVAAFGGDQFTLPEQTKQLEWFFSMFYLNFQSGSLITSSITPIVLDQVNCFGQGPCHAFAFGIPTLFMIFGLIMFIIGRPFYTIIRPLGNMILLVIKAVYTAIRMKFNEDETNPRRHWYEYVEENFSHQLAVDIKAILWILLLFAPLHIVWTLIFIVLHNWIQQANSMDGDMGSLLLRASYAGFLRILLIIAIIPVCHYAIYPALNIVGIKRPLQRMVFGGMLAALAFIISGILELALEETYPVIPSDGKTQLRIFNGEPCDYTFRTNIPHQETFDIEAFGYFEYKHISVDNGEFQFNFKIEAKSDAPECSRFSPDTYSMKEKTAQSLFMASHSPIQKLIWYEDVVAQPKTGEPYAHARVLTNVQDERRVSWKSTETDIIEHEEYAYDHELSEFFYGGYKILIDQTKVFETYLKIGGVYTFMIAGNVHSGYIVKVFVVTKPNSINILWVIPQFVVITLADVMFSVAALEFSYLHAPRSLKSIVMACLLWTMQMGPEFSTISNDPRVFNSMAVDIFVCAFFMIADMLLLAVLAYFYKPNSPAA